MTIDWKVVSNNNKRAKNLSDFRERGDAKNPEKSTVDQLIYDEIINEIEENHADLIADIVKGKKNKNILETVIEEVIEKSKHVLGLSKAELIKSQVDQIIGWGKLQPLIDEGTITDIFTNMELEVVKRVSGEDVKTNIKFDSDEELEQYIKSIMIRTGEKINRDKCIADAYDHLYNVRINAGIYGSPTRKEVVRRPYLVLRLYPAMGYTEKEFLENGTFNEKILDFLKNHAVSAKVAIVGQPGAGKSTLLDFIMSLYKRMKRAIIIEEEAELKFMNDNCIFFEERKSGKEDTRYKYDMAEFARICTRLGGRVVSIGEVRGKEAWFLKRLIDMGYEAIYSVHGGDCLKGIKQTAWLMSLNDPQMSIEMMVKELCDSLDFVIFVKQKMILDIAEVIGYDDVKKEPILNYIFRIDVNDRGEFYWNEGTLSDEYIKRHTIESKLKERAV